MYVHLDPAIGNFHKNYTQLIVRFLHIRPLVILYPPAFPPL